MKHVWKWYKMYIIFWVGTVGIHVCRRKCNETDVKIIVLEGVDWIYLAKDRDRQRVRVNVAKNLRLHITRVNSLPYEYQLLNKLKTELSEKIVAFWDIASCSLVEVDRRFTGVYCFQHYNPDEAIRTSETSAYFNQTTPRYILERCHHHTCLRENLKSQRYVTVK
jgi:hypothetical protein